MVCLLYFDCRNNLPVKSARGQQKKVDSSRSASRNQKSVPSSRKSEVKSGSRKVSDIKSPTSALRRETNGNTTNNNVSLCDTFSLTQT